MTQYFLSARRRHAHRLSAIKWIGTAAGVAGAAIVAINIGAVAFGFMLFLVSSILWGIAGWIEREASLVVLQGTFTVINVLGIVRWLGA